MFDGTDGDPNIPQTPFYRSYLMRRGRYSKAKFTFRDFKDQYRERSLTPAEQVEELRRFCRYELMLRRPRKCEDAEIGRAGGTAQAATGMAFNRRSEYLLVARDHFVVVRVAGGQSVRMTWSGAGDDGPDRPDGK